MLTFTTWNVNGLKTQQKINKLLSLCNSYDFVCVQETHTENDLSVTLHLILCCLPNQPPPSMLNLNLLESLKLER